GTRQASNARRGTRTGWRRPGTAPVARRYPGSRGPPVFDQRGGVRALAIAQCRARRPDVDEAGDLLVRGDAEQAQDRRVVGRPARQPLRAEAMALRRLQQREADTTCRGEALGLRDLRV